MSKFKIIAATLAAVACSTAHAQNQNIGVGQELTFHSIPNLNADNYGCYDLGNTQELERMRATGFSGSREGDRLDQQIVTRYVGAHRFENSSHSPKFSSNVCVRIFTEEPYKVAKTFDWPGGGPRLYCLELMRTMDVRSADQVAADEAKGGVEPVCWWVSLNRTPALVR